VRSDAELHAVATSRTPSATRRSRTHPTLSGHESDFKLRGRRTRASSFGPSSLGCSGEA